jgi:hypothetical protein
MGWKGYLILLGVCLGWVVMVRWVLPMCGIETCCSSAGQCRQCDVPPPNDVVPSHQEKQHQGDQP